MLVMELHAQLELQAKLDGWMRPLNMHKRNFRHKTCG